ncbi:MAG: SPFH domain-containing protein [Eubacteriales bacterium]|nr:SPFH domain-containing protein [Eubacteriales bacterium]
MGFFSGQLANVVEWQETREDIIFYKWNNDEIKKGSRLIIRPGQDAVFMYNGKTEGIFQEEGSYDIESDIIPFLSSLQGFRFGFNSGLRAEVLFINTKEFVMKWGTRQAVNLPHPSLPGGMPIRANGTFQFKVGDYQKLIDKVAGVKKQFTTEEVRERVASMLDQLLLQWIVREGKDMFNLSANASEISRGIMKDLDEEIEKIGLSMTGFQINSVTYPEEVQNMINKVAGQNMVGDMDRYQQMAMIDAMTGGTQGGNVAADMASMQMGMMMGQQMVDRMSRQSNSMPPTQSSGGEQSVPNFCPNCGQKTNGANFCANCGQKLI